MVYFTSLCRNNSFVRKKRTEADVNAFLWCSEQCWVADLWMRSSRVVRASDSQCRSRNCPWFDPSILRHSESEGRQMKQCWISYVKRKNTKRKIPIQETAPPFNQPAYNSVHAISLVFLLHSLWEGPNWWACVPSPQPWILSTLFALLIWEDGKQAARPQPAWMSQYTSIYLPWPISSL